MAGSTPGPSSDAAQEREGWRGLFRAAFTQSRNPMALLDSDRRQRDFNGAYLRLLGRRREELLGRPIYESIKGGPIFSERQWQEQLARGRFSGTAEMLRADGSGVRVQWAVTVEVITGQREILFVALVTSRAGGYSRRQEAADFESRSLSDREREIVHLIAMGYTGPEIAEELCVTHNTVRSHIRNAMDKSGAHSRAHLVAKALGEAIALRKESRQITQR